MANDIKELSKFCNDPKYREKVIARVHKDMDKEYNQRIKNLEAQKNTLIVSRNNEISRISNSRWESYANNRLMVNRTEGTISVNNCVYFFLSINGAQINMVPGYRIIQTETATTKGRKHASVGGAIVGGMIAGPVGAVVGGAALGKTKSTTQGRVVTNQIPTCMHLGVVVILDGFANEIVLLSQQVDQSSSVFVKAYQEAQNMVAILGSLARTPVPQYVLRPEEEPSVKLLDAQIENKQKELEFAVADVPTYALPDMYRTAEQRSMSDEEYLQYLREADAQRMAQIQADKELKKAQIQAAKEQKKAQIQAAKEQKKLLSNTENQTANNITSPIETKTSGTLRKVGKRIFVVSFWIVSVALSLLALIMFASQGGIITGIIWLLTAISVNPLIGDLIYNKVVRFPRWIVAIILVVGFFAGIFAFSSPQTTSDTSSSESTVATVVAITTSDVSSSESAVTSAAAIMTTQATKDESSVDHLYEISNDVTKLWNEVFVEARDYAAHGTSCTGEPLDIDFVISTMDKYYDKVVEDKAYIDTLGDEYSDIKLAFDKLYEKAEIIYNNLKEETPEANTPLSYAEEIDLFQQYHMYFYDAVNELKYGN